MKGGDPGDRRGVQRTGIRYGERFRVIDRLNSDCTAALVR